MVRRNGLLWFSPLAIVLILVTGGLQDSIGASLGFIAIPLTIVGILSWKTAKPEQPKLDT